ncbi:MAG: DUF262 domain-containing protein [Gammaproteobacteria bacterium]|nr:DUF262 domain-containing protein [Gammaproteobacteria bacterium]MCY4226456.1 DUF262 domain-containing protein [Gammaproteobacteria bacterium]MCY4313503.1 DUF262 domain-containing protein [Gammaproteobacteria bacterium]
MNDQIEAELEEELEISPAEDGSEFLDKVMEPFNPSEIDIVVEPKSLDALIERIQHNEIDMNTDFQRHADLWDNRKMSRLIESILIRFPLPAFYFDASEDHNWLIVDGLQRLSSIRKFVIDGKLKLSGLEFLTDLNGATYDSLHRTYQRRIKECPVTVYMIKPGTPVDVKYSVFRRINTGGLTLNNQEIRNALAKPADRRLLQEIAEDVRSIEMLGDLSKRMRDQELVLRFWAFHQFDYLDPGNRKELASFLDKAMDQVKEGDEEYRLHFKGTYFRALGRCRELLGTSGFQKNPDPDSAKRSINSTLFEVWMVEMARLSDDEYMKARNKREMFSDRSRLLLNDREFTDAITYSTQIKDHVETRYRKVQTLIEEVLGD